MRGYPVEHFRQYDKYLDAVTQCWLDFLGPQSVRMFFVFADHPANAFERSGFLRMASNACFLSVTASIYDRTGSNRVATEFAIRGIAHIGETDPWISSSNLLT